MTDGAIGGAERLTSLAALFPHVAFGSVGPSWPDRSPLDLLVVQVNGSDAVEVDDAVRRLKSRATARHVVVILREADVVTTRRLVREGAADVLPYPASEPALALSLERILSGDALGTSQERKRGEVVALLKAGGGVGATSLGVQAATQLARRLEGQVCFADLDLQFGAAAIYLDLPEAATVTDFLAAGPAIAESPFGEALATHRTGARLLAAPRELTALETLTPVQADAVIRGLRRDFSLTIVDLPSVWTAWTNQVLTVADRIVMVTELSVPHTQLVRRQLRMLTAQQLDSRPIVLVCNQLTADHQASVSLKAAEKAVGRDFDVVVAEDRKLMNAAINQGVEVAEIRRGTKLEKAIGLLAGKVAEGLSTAAPTRKWW